MSLETNKIVAAILLAGLIGMASGFVADLLMHPETPEETAIAVETGGEAEASGAQEDEQEVIQPVVHLMAEADPQAGREAFRACSACHTIEEGGSHGVGPNLWDKVGTEMASTDFGNYSSALQERGGVWTYEALNRFIHNPSGYVEGTQMGYSGQDNVRTRANIIAYLRQNSNDPHPLPDTERIRERITEFRETYGADAELVGADLVSDITGSGSSDGDGGTNGNDGGDNSGDDGANGNGDSDSGAGGAESGDTGSGDM